MKELKNCGIAGCICICLILLASCTEIPFRLLRENQSYRTPIPESTLKAYREGTPITNKLQAVIAARILLSTSRMENIQTPQVIYVQRMTLAEAIKKAEKPGVETFEDIPLQTPVWFIIFQGDWQLHPPLPGITATPLPPFHGCQYVWITENNNGYAATGDIDCAAP